MELITTTWTDGLDNSTVARLEKLAAFAEKWFQTTKEFAAELAAAREAVPSGTWQRYCEEQMPLNIRLITDLIRMHDGLPTDSQLWELPSKRAAAIAASTDAETQAVIEAEFTETGKMTEARVNEIIKPNKPKPETKKDLEAKLDAALEANDALRKENQSLRRQNAEAAEAQLIKMQLDDLYMFEQVVLSAVSKHSELMPDDKKVALLLKILKMMGADGRKRGIKELREGIKIMFGEEIAKQLDGQLQLPAPRIAGQGVD
jgi:hypothetical protein